MSGHAVESGIYQASLWNVVHVPFCQKELLDSLFIILLLFI